MPPSGYSPDQAASICAFLKSCSLALAEEAARDGLTFVQALQREINDITAMVEIGHDPASAIATMELTRTFYQRIKDAAPETAPQFEQAVQSVLDAIRAEILAVHVPPNLSTMSLADQQAALKAK